MQQKTKNIIQWSTQNKFWVFFFTYHLLFFIGSGWNVEKWIICIFFSLATYFGTTFLVIASTIFAREKGSYKIYLEEGKNPLKGKPLIEELVFSYWKPIWILSILIRNSS